MKSGQLISLTVTNEHGETKEFIKPLIVREFEVCVQFGNTSVEIIPSQVHPGVGAADFWYDGEIGRPPFVPKHLW